MQKDAQFYREQSLGCVALWEAALQRYVDDCCYTSIDGIPPEGWDNDEAYQDLYGSQELLGNLLQPFDLSSSWVADLVKRRVDLFKANHVEDDQKRLFR